MGKEDELVKLKRFDNAATIEWSEEPWYDTKYKVERLSEDFVELVRLKSCPQGRF